MKNIFVIGLDESNLHTDLMEKAEKALDAFDGSIDATIGYWDFPVSTLVPLLSERYGTRSTSLESVVKCEHKYWSRLERGGGPRCGRHRRNGTDRFVRRSSGNAARSR